MDAGAVAVRPKAFIRLLSLTFLLLSGASAVWAQPQRITVNSPSVNFREVFVGESRSAAITIGNVGGLPLVVQRLSIGPADFSVDSVGPTTIPPGQFWTVTVAFAPLTGGRTDGVLRIDGNDPAQNAVEVPLTGVGAVRPPPPPPPPRFRIGVSPAEVQLSPGDSAPVYTFEETGGRPVAIRAAAAYVEFADGSRLDLNPLPFTRTLGPRDTLTLDDSVRLPEAFLDRVRRSANQGIEQAVFVRTFVGTADGQQEVQQARVVLVPVGSLGADFAITTLAVDFPPSGMTVGAGTSLHARGLVFGSGSGTALVTWLVDGVAIESSTVDLTAGRPVAVESLVSLPTALIGLHEIELEVREPSRLRSRPVRYLVTSRPIGPLRWVLQPGFRIYLKNGALPEWGWTPQIAAHGGADVLLARPVLVATTGPLDRDRRARIRLLLDGTDLTEFVSWGPDRVQVTSPIAVPEGPHIAELRAPAADGQENVVARS